MHLTPLNYTLNYRNHRIPKHVRQISTELNVEIYNSIIVGNFNPPLSINDLIIRKKINKKT